MGVTGEGYPNGTLYESVFTARFTDVKVLASGVYEAKICDQSIAKPQDTEEIIDGTLHVYTLPYGIETEACPTFTFYAPGYKVSSLPEEARKWLSMNMSVPEGTETLPCWVAYDWQSEDFATFYGK